MRVGIKQDVPTVWLMLLLLNQMNPPFTMVAGSRQQYDGLPQKTQKSSIKSVTPESLLFSSYEEQLPIPVLNQQAVEGQLFHRHLLSGLSFDPPEDIEMRYCNDATEYFYWKFSSDENNLYKQYFDCQCTGDIQTKFILTCSMDNYCGFTDEEGEQCINVRHEYSFTVSKATDEYYGFIDSLEWSNYCTEYLSDNGPVSGQLCDVNGGVCAITVHNDHGLGARESSELCVSLYCNEKLEELGYSKKRIDELCPSTTLNGKNCNSPTVYDYSGGCSDSEGSGSENDYNQNTADCSNVEPCATSSCNTLTSVPTENILEERLIYKLDRYPQCPGEESSEKPFAKFLLRKADGDGVPVIKKCNWLAKKEKINSKKKICSSKKFQLYSEEDGLSPASLVCTDTCSSFCTKEVGQVKFIAGTKVGDDGEKVVVLKTCRWLSKQSTEMITSICATTIEFEDTIYGQASEVCTTSCGCP